MSSNTSLPTTHRAIVVEKPGNVVIKEQPLPHLDEDRLLVRVKVVALNPVDPMHVDQVLKPGQSVGCDFAGEVVAIGSKAQDKGFSIGDSVVGFTRGGFLVSDNGAFQEHVTTLPESVWRKPDSLPYEDAVAMGGVTISTAYYALHFHLQMPLGPLSAPEPFLVWAGSTAVGMYSIKLASLAGYKVVTVASKHNWDLVKSLGASAVFDYKDPDVVKYVKQWASDQGLGPIKKGIDTFSKHESVEKCIEILSDGAGELAILLAPPEDADTKGVKYHRVLLFTILDPKNEKDFKRMAEWYNIVPSYVESGKLPKGLIPLKVYNGGLEDICEALDYLRQEKTSGQKVVVVLK